MRERHIFWDVAPLVLLATIAIMLGVQLYDRGRGHEMLVQLRKENAALAQQQQAMLRVLTDEGVKIKGGQAAVTPHPGTSPEVPAVPNGQTPPTHPTPPVAGRHPLYPNDPDVPPDAEPQALPHFERGDENAEDGDWAIYALSGEPNSLNALIDNDATASTLFNRVHDGLASRYFDDLSVWEPKLAKAWKQELVCYAYPKDGDAAKLAKEIEAAWDAKVRESLKIQRIDAAELSGEKAVRISIGAVNNDYGERLKKEFGDKVWMQYWFYVTIDAPYLMDGDTEAKADRVAAQVMGPLKELKGLTGRFISPWNREDSTVLRLLGTEADRDLVFAKLKEMVASPDNQGKVPDAKETSGKRVERLFGCDLVEDYIAQEKPVFTFYMRKDVKWDDNAPLTGKDVVFAFDMTKNPKVECGPARNYYQDCESCELVDGDPYKVRFTWAKPYFAAFENSAGFSPMAEHYYPKDPQKFNTGDQNQSLVGCGGYKLEAWDKGKQIAFVRNEGYYGKKPHFKKIIYKVVKDPAVQLQLLDAQELDVNGLTPNQWLGKKDDAEFLKKIAVDVSVANVYRYVGWNSRKPWFKDKQVRQALTMLIDRERICEHIYRGYAIVQHGNVHPDSPMFWPGIVEADRKFAHNSAKGRQQLAAAGWRDSDGDGILDKDGVKFEFTLLIVSPSSEYESIANLIKDEFAKAGIVVNINNLEWSAFLQKIERLQFDACVLGWRLGITDDPYQLWHSSQNGEKESNHCNFVNKRADELIERMRRELNQERRKEMMTEFQKILHEEQPYTFLFVQKRIVGYDKRIQNVKYKLIGADEDRWWVPLGQQKYK
ncbi:MAG: hypothetical protein HS116_05030 [Planctomycetes bacterium]|nr:hypothetical protein [Planctomycetota bacterium]